MNQVEFVIKELEKLKSENGNLYVIMRDSDCYDEFVKELHAWKYVEYTQWIDINNPLDNSIEREVMKDKNKEDFNFLSETNENDNRLIVETGGCVNFERTDRLENKSDRLRIDDILMKLKVFRDKGFTAVSTGGRDDFYEIVELSYYYVLENKAFDSKRLEVTTSPDEEYDGYFIEDHKGEILGIEKGKCIYIF